MSGDTAKILLKYYNLKHIPDRCIKLGSKASKLNGTFTDQELRKIANAMNDLEKLEKKGV